MNKEHASSAAIHDGVPVDHPQIIEMIRNGIKLGWNNETICRTSGMPPEVIDKQRALMRIQK